MKLILLVASMLLLLPYTATAQTPVAIPGLEVIAERQYAVDSSAAIDAREDGLFLVSARVYLFDSPESADSTWDTLVAAESIEQDLPTDDDSITYERTDLEEVGDRAVVQYVNVEVTEEETGSFRTVIIQTDAKIVTVTALGGSGEATEIADEIAIAMSEREVGEDDSQYDGLGASTGGVWDVFLPAGAEELDDLQAYADKETRPA